jgi:flagellar biogenesis protein FliO
LLQTGLALAFVLVLLFITAWCLKRATPRSLQPLPIETVQVLGNAPLHGKQHLRLIRLGQRLLLLAVSETTTQTLTEVTDPNEVQQLLELCQIRSPQSVSQAFETLLQDGARERTTGFLGSQQDQIALPRRASPAAPPADTARSTASRPPVRPASHHFFEA